MVSQLKAVIFGAIGSIAETSDLQRQAFNAAFKDAGLPWNWDAASYRNLLETNGGQNRIRAYRDAHPSDTEITDTTIAALHAAKTEYYVAMLDRTNLQPRPGVVELMNDCKRHDIQVAFCTSTSRDNVNGLRTALSDVLPFEQFATIVTIDKITRTKPAPDAYLYCLEQLGLSADQVIAIEDTPISLAAAKSAGIMTIATPGETTSNQDFSAADLVLPDLTSMTVERLQALLEARFSSVN